MHFFGYLFEYGVGFHIYLEFFFYSIALRWRNAMRAFDMLFGYFFYFAPKKRVEGAFGHLFFNDIPFGSRSE